MSLSRYPRYPAYKDSGVEWLGEVPAHWEVRRTDSILRYDKQQVQPSRLASDEAFHYSIPVIHETGDGQIEPVNSIDSAKLLITAERVLVSKLNPRKGMVLLARPHSLPTVASTEFVPFEPIDTNSQWAIYLILAASTRERISATVRSATRSHQRAEVADITKLWHAVPPQSEQRGIAEFLDRETARIDALIEKKRQLISLLKEQRTALITRAVTRGLDPHAPMKESGVEWLGEIPAHWEARRLRHVVSRIEQGWSPDCENRAAEADEWGVMKAGCVNGGVFDETDHKTLPNELDPPVSLEIRPGDLLMSRASGSRELVGSVAVVENCRPRLLLCDKLFRLASQSHMHVRFLAYALAAKTTRAQILVALSGGSGMANNIAQSVVKELWIAVPPLDEQLRIAKCVTEGTAALLQAEERIEAVITRLTELRTALITATVTGAIDVRGYAPSASTDE